MTSEREQIVKRIIGFFGDDRETLTVKLLTAWHLEEKEKAYSAGRASAAQKIFSVAEENIQRCQKNQVQEDDYLDGQITGYVVIEQACDQIITEAEGK